MFFRPVEVFSLDSFFAKSKNRQNNFLEIYIFFLINFGFVYLDSITYKFSHPMWYRGLGLWTPLMHPMVSFFDFDFISNYKPLMVFLGMTTIFFEIIVSFFILFKPLRLITAIIGISLHLGIAMVFPLQNFGLFFVAGFFIFFVPNSFYSFLFKGNKIEETLAFL